MAEKEPQQTEKKELSLKDFFEKVPPGNFIPVKIVAHLWSADRPSKYKFSLPNLELHCDKETCTGIRFFEPTDQEVYVREGQTTPLFTNFRCRNCGQRTKTYALLCLLRDHQSAEILKLGELPSFGPPTPARVITLIGPDREYYLKGGRAENQGLGIAAFAYYRRVVENQKNRILDEIIKVAEKLGAAKEDLEDLRAAREETQFSKAVEKVKRGIPKTLLVSGHNPLTLLHGALSDGLHDQTDEHCLELATSIRVVLTDLAERLGNALKDSAELSTAVNRLLKTNAPQNPTTSKSAEKSL